MGQLDACRFPPPPEGAATIMTTRPMVSAKAAQLLAELREEAALWGVPAGHPDTGLLHGRWRSGAPLWSGWLPEGTVAPARMTPETASSATDEELPTAASRWEGAVARFSALRRYSGGEDRLLGLITRLESYLHTPAPYQEPVYHLLLGVPGAGKSTLASRVGPGLPHLDPDRLRYMRPWWCEGLRLTRTRDLIDCPRDRVFEQAVANRESLLEEAVGVNAAKLESRVRSAVTAGYEVTVTLLETPTPEVLRRRLGRSAVSGRVINARYLSLASDTARTFDVLRANHPTCAFTRLDTGAVLS
jgi:predicted kinase